MPAATPPLAVSSPGPNAQGALAQFAPGFSGFVTRVQPVVQVGAVVHGRYYMIVYVGNASGSYPGNVIAILWSGYVWGAPSSGGGPPASVPSVPLNAGEAICALVFAGSKAVATDKFAVLITFEQEAQPGQGSFIFSEPPGTGDGDSFSLGVTNPGAGADFVFTIPSLVKQRFRGCRAQLVTSAAVANRNVSFCVTDPLGNALQRAWALASSTTLFSQVASTTQLYWHTRGMVDFFGSIAPAAVNQVRVPMPPGSDKYQAGFVFKSITGGLDAGDQWSLIFIEIEEWAVAP
jgi:hypothetical protein